MGPGGCLCLFDNSPQMELAQRRQMGLIAGATQHPMLHIIIPRNPVFAVSNPTMEKDDPGWSTSNNIWQPIIPQHGSKWESVVAPTAPMSKQWRNGGRKVVCFKTFLPLFPLPFRHRPSEAISGKESGVCRGQFGMRTSQYALCSARSLKKNFRHL